jgi:hypothetical protein
VEIFMVGKNTQRRGLGWHMPLYAVIAAVILFLPLIKESDNDVLYLFVVMPGLFLVGICALVYAAFRRNGRIAVASLMFWAVSALLFSYATEIRTATRWLLWSHEYKKEVLAQPASTNGDLKHIEWDGWGWAGMDTTVFLVFDPTDSLAAAAKNQESGKFSGIPCEASLVRRMESHWYTVTSMVAGWGRCS